MKHQFLFFTIFSFLLFNSCGDQESNGILQCDRLKSIEEANNLM